MTERERLINLINTTLAENIGKSVNLAENITDYLLDNGVIVPLYKFGDKAYVIKQSHIEDFKILDVGSGGFVVELSPVHLIYYDNEEIGECVFLSKAEAEKALNKKLNKKGE